MTLHFDPERFAIQSVFTLEQSVFTLDQSVFTLEQSPITLEQQVFSRTYLIVEYRSAIQ